MTSFFQRHYSEPIAVHWMAYKLRANLTGVTKQRNYHNAFYGMIYVLKVGYGIMFLAILQNYLKSSSHRPTRIHRGGCTYLKIKHVNHLGNGQSLENYILSFEYCCIAYLGRFTICQAFMLLF